MAIRNPSLFFLFSLLLMSTGVNLVVAQPYWLKVGSFASYEVRGGFILDNKSYFNSLGYYKWECINVNSSHALLVVSFYCKPCKLSRSAKIWVNLENGSVYFNGKEIGFQVFWLPAGEFPPSNKTVGKYRNRIFLRTIWYTKVDIKTPYKHFKGEELLYVDYYYGYNATTGFVMGGGGANYEKDTRLMISSEFDPVLEGVLGVELIRAAPIPILLNSTNIFEPIIARGEETSFLLLASVILFVIMSVLLAIVLIMKLGIWRS